MRELIYKIERMMSDSSINKINNATFTLDGKELGKLEIRVQQNNKEEQGVILVENHTVKEQLQKILPDIQQNLNQKGSMITAINVEVNTGEDKNFERNKFMNRNMNKKLNSITADYSENVTDRTKTKKNYGYNTMEVLA